LAANKRAIHAYSLPLDGDRPIAALADEQHGVVEHCQLVDRGYTREAIRHRVESGRLHPRYRGVYTVGHRTLTREGHLMAAVLAYGPNAVLSHRSAAALWGLRPDGGMKFDVTVPGTSRKQRPKIRVHRARRLHPADVTVVDNIPVTSLARTLIDLAAVVHPTTLVKAIEASERLELFDLTGIDAAIARAPTRKGVRRLRTALAAYRPPPTTKSRLERDTLKRLHARGMPEPHINSSVHGEEADLHWPNARLIVELDGAPYHRSPRELARDRRKDAIWTRHGEAVLRFTDERLETDMTGAISDVIAVYEQRLRGASP
jgi:very-short-patch-repair endonuclease